MFDIPADIMQETVVVHPVLSKNAYGQSIYGDDGADTGYLEAGYRTVIDAQGEELVVNLLGIFGATCTIQVGYEITWNSRRYRAINVEVYRIAGVDHHVEIDFQSVAR